MRAVMLAPPQDFLAERRARGADRWDEVWEGVLHMPPPPSANHQRIAGKLWRVLAPLADARGLEVWHETGLFRPGAAERDYRVPDLMAARPELASERGVEGPADLVVEILSPEDETYDKLPFYESLGVREVLVVEPKTRAAELYVLRGGKLRAMTPDASGALRSEVLGAALRVLDGPSLRVTWDGGQSDV
jgi:Uma2 family endonuclease